MNIINNNQEIYNILALYINKELLDNNIISYYLYQIAEDKITKKLNW